MIDLHPYEHPPVHRMGIILKPFITLGCVDCYKKFGTLWIMDYLEFTLGEKQGMDYWRLLRLKCEEMRREWKKGVRFEGYWVPEI